MNFRPSLILLAIILFFYSMGSINPGLSTYAQSNTPQMTASAAYSGYFKYGEWLPVWVELENQGADVDGEVRVEVQSSQGTLVYMVPVSLPSGSRKLTPVYVLPNNFSRELVVKLVSKGKTLASSTTAVKPQANVSFFAGLVAPQRGALNLLGGIKPPGQERPKILVDLQTDDLPERAEALNSFDVLVFNDVDTSELSPGQKDALGRWVLQGGHLIIGGGAGAQQTLSGFPEFLVPLIPENTSEISGADAVGLSKYAQTEPILASGPFVIARGRLAEKSAVLAGNDDTPLVIAQEIGSGIVHFISLDLAAAPFNGWTGCQDFWETIIGPRGGYPENMPFDMSLRQFRANSLFYSLSNIPSLDLPSIKAILILLVIYVLFIGPVNYLILRRMRKLHLAWVTIPAVTAFFALGTFGLGYTMRGNDLILNKIALIQLDSSGNASVTSYMGLFSPRQQAYEITVLGDNLLSPMSGYEYDPWGNTGANTSGGEMVFIQGQPSRLRGLTVNQWSMQSFMSESAWANFGNLEADLTLKNDILVGKVRNASQYSLTDVVVIMQNRFQRLGDMALGEEREVNLGLSNLQSDRFGPSISYRLFQENLSDGSGASPNRINDQKMNIVSSVFENGPWMKMISSSSIPSSIGTYTGGVILMGWLDQAPPEVIVEGIDLSYKTTALVFRGVDYQVPENGILTIPTGLIPGTITKYPPGSGNCGTSTSLNMGQGEAELEYQVPDNLSDTKITTLKVALYQDSGVAMTLPEIGLYNWEKETWTNIQDPIQGTNIIQNAAPYVNNLKIQLRIRSDSVNFSCLYIDMGLEAERQGLQGETQ